jgi:hypothetical protein
MRHKPFLWVAIVAASTIATVLMTQMNFVSAQQGGEAGIGGAGGTGGAGGAGGGGGGSFDDGGGSIAAHGDFVYVLRRGNLYQYAAYDLRLIKKSDLNGNGASNRGRRGQAGGRGGDGAPGGDADGGRGGAGGAGGFGFGDGAFGSSEAVAAYGEFVYVLQGTTLRKLYADGLKPMKKVPLDFDLKSVN